MPISEAVSQWWARLKLVWFLLLAAIAGVAWIAYRRYRDARSAAQARQAQAIGRGYTYDAIERAEQDRNRMLAASRAQAAQAKRAREAADRIAARLSSGGHPKLAELIKRWNGE